MATDLKMKEKNSVQLFKEGKFTKAKLGFQAMLMENESNFNCLFYLGRIKLLENNLENAKELFLKALSLKPKKE